MAKKKKKDASLGKHASNGADSKQSSNTTKIPKDASKYAASDIAAYNIAQSPDKTDVFAPVAKGKSSSVDASVNDGTARLPVLDAAVQPGVVFDFSEKTRKRKKVLKGFGIFFAILLGLLVLAYGAGCLFFMDRFWPNTTIGDHDVSLKTPEESAPIFTGAASDYYLDIEGEGFSLTLSSTDLGLGVNGEEIVTRALEVNKPWMWPLEITKEHDGSEYLSAIYEKDMVSQQVQAAVDDYNASATSPTNATIAYDEPSKQFKVVSEEVGTALDVTAVMRVVDAAVSNLESPALVTSEELQKPLINSTHEQLLVAQASANNMIKTDLSLTMGGNEVTTLGPATIAEWIRLGDDLTVTFDDDAFGGWIETIIASCNTVGIERTYTRPDGKVVTVEGGSYGWEVDNESFRVQIREAASAGQTGVFEIPVLQSGNGFSGNGQDWGNRYVDIDLSEQYARFYDASGNIIWESAIVSGTPIASRATPTGVYKLNNKESPSTLIGRMDPETKKPEYETKVQFWMPFKGNAVGLHDATWQSAFGGTRYKDGWGSHGCVNLPYSAAESIYSLIEIGDVVITHW